MTIELVKQTQNVQVWINDSGDITAAGKHAHILPALGPDEAEEVAGALLDAARKVRAERRLPVLPIPQAEVVGDGYQFVDTLDEAERHLEPNLE